MNTVKVMIVDDSLVFRSQIRNCIAEIEGVEVVNLAKNGAVAIEYLKNHPVDLMILDLEMPQLDGISTLEAMASLAHKPKVFVFSANTTKGAQKSLEAMRLGAIDVICKPAQQSDGNTSIKERIGAELLPKVGPFVQSLRNVAPTKTQSSPIPAKSKAKRFLPAAVVVGSSTGGPVALEHLLANLPKAYSCPIIIAQHMPPLFTATLAKRLALVTGKNVKEAEHDEVISSEWIYIAPGDNHLEVAATGKGAQFVLSQKEKRNSVRPAIDYLFESAAELWQESVLAFVLTGMGADGKDGSKVIKERGGTVVIQDKETSVVWGMPGAVHLSGMYDEMLSISGCASILNEFLSHSELPRRKQA